MLGESLPQRLKTYDLPYPWANALVTLLSRFLGDAILMYKRWWSPWEKGAVEWALERCMKWIYKMIKTEISHVRDENGRAKKWPVDVFTLILMFLLSKNVHTLKHILSPCELSRIPMKSKFLRGDLYFKYWLIPICIANIVSSSMVSHIM